MLGTGESPSSSSESITPSTMSSSWTVGTYCCHIGSPISLIVLRTFGVSRIWKLSNAGCSPSTSMTSDPYRSASLSRVSTLSWRIFCQSLMRDDSVRSWGGGAGVLHLRVRETFDVHHPGIARGVEVGEARGFRHAVHFVELSRRRIVVSRRRLDDEQPSFSLTKTALDLIEQLRSAAFTLKRGVHRNPIQIVCAIGARRRAVAHVSDELPFARERPHELVVRHAVARIVRRACRSRREGFVEQLERHLDFVVTKDRRGVEYLTDPIAMPPV